MTDPNAPITLQVLETWLEGDIKVKIAGGRVPTLWIKLF